MGMNGGPIKMNGGLIGVNGMNGMNGMNGGDEGDERRAGRD